MNFRRRIKTPSPALCVALLALTAAAIALGACGDDANTDAADKAEAREQAAKQAGTDGVGSSNTSTGAPSTDSDDPASGECERQVIDGKYISYVCPEGVEPPADDGTQLADPAPAEEPAPGPVDVPATPAPTEEPSPIPPIDD
jgi:hypothetical protein